MDQRAVCLRRFLQARKPYHNNPALMDLYEAGAECQVNVARSGGQPVDDQRNTYTDGHFVWHNFRIGNADDAEKWLTYPLDPYVKEIGLSGWNWQRKRSLWVGFDFDDLVSHAPGIGTSKEELVRVRMAASNIPWMEARRSTGGGDGLHLAAHFDAAGIPTDDHSQHAGLARCVLGMASTIVGFDLSVNVDCCGRILWVWSQRATADNHGFEQLEPATATLSEADLPSNWRDQIDVVAHRRARVRVRGIADANESAFDSLTSAFNRAPLDDKHKAIIEGLSHTGFSTIWVPDHHVLQTHTVALERLLNERRESLGLLGVFDTVSPGMHPDTPNCFMVPFPEGAWKVFRFSPGVKESATWRQDGKEWTTCYFNRKPDLTTVAQVMGGDEDPDKLGFVFDTAEMALEAAKLLGQQIQLPETFMGRRARLKAHKDGRLVMDVDKHRDEGKVKGWVAKPDHFTRVFDTIAEPGEPETNCDDLVRALITPAGESAGFMLRSNCDTWDRQSAANVRMRLQAKGMTKNQADCVIGAAIGDRWTLVNMPFQPEFPGGRRLNLDAPQFRFAPVRLKDGELPYHPTWNRILQHIGADLDESVATTEWCRQNDVRTGADWLLILIACILRDPFEPTPYLGLWGPENSGKSIFHEAFSVLVTKGVVAADRALTNQNGFNGELANAILAVVEETNLAQSGWARERMKDWVTCRQLSIRRMRTDQYQQPNSLHFVQCVNRLDYFPVWPGDSRITICHVPELNPEDKIKKTLMLKRLADEAPHFMATLMALRLPEPDDRLRIASLETPDKIALAHQNAPIALFVREQCILERDAKVAKCDAFTKYKEWCKENNYEIEGQTKFSDQVIEFSGGTVRRAGKALGADGKRHDAYQGICLAQAV